MQTTLTPAPPPNAAPSSTSPSNTAPHNTSEAGLSLRIEALRSDIRALQTQLGQAVVTHPDGTRLTGAEYRAFKSEVQAVLNTRLDELSAARAQIKALRARRRNPQPVNRSGATPKKLVELAQRHAGILSQQDIDLLYQASRILKGSHDEA